MLTIRSDQMMAFHAQARRDLARRVLDQLRPYFAGQLAVLGDPGAIRTVELGVERAASYGLGTEREVFLYTALMFMLGSRFDVDPQLPWVAPLLAAESAKTPFKRIERTYAEAMDYLDRTAGEDGRAHVDMLLGLKKLDYDAAARSLDPDFDAGMIALLHAVHPRKSGYLGTEGMRALIAGSERAQRRGLVSPRGRMVHVLIALVLGSDYDEDPQFPWASRVLRDPDLDSAQRAEALRLAALDHLDRSLAQPPEADGEDG